MFVPTQSLSAIQFGLDTGLSFRILSLSSIKVGSPGVTKVRLNVLLKLRVMFAVGVDLIVSCWPELFRKICGSNFGSSPINVKGASEMNRTIMINRATISAISSFRMRHSHYSSLAGATSRFVVVW